MKNRQYIPMVKTIIGVLSVSIAAVFLVGVLLSNEELQISGSEHKGPHGLYSRHLPLLETATYYDDGEEPGVGPVLCGPCASCGGCGTCGIIVIVVIPIAWFVINILLMIWMARDAKSRGVDSAGVWVLGTLFFGFIVVIIYMFSRPIGVLVQCTHCGNKKLEAMKTCPHCGN